MIQKAAFTIIEIIVSASLLLLLISLALPLFLLIAGLPGRGGVESTFSVFQDARSALLFLSSELKRASPYYTQLESPYAEGGYTYYRGIIFQVVNANANEELLRIPPDDPLGDLSWGDGQNGGNYLRYRVVPQPNNLNLNLFYLVRERLNSNFGVIQQQILARNVIDFRICLRDGYYELFITAGLYATKGRLLSSPFEYSLATTTTSYL